MTSINQEQQMTELEQGLLNRDYLDYLLGRLLDYLIEQIEPHKFSSPTT